MSHIKALKNLTCNREVWGAFSADDPLEARVGVAVGSLGSVSRESEKSLGEKTPFKEPIELGLFSIGPHFLIAKANKGGECAIT